MDVNFTFVQYKKNSSFGFKMKIETIVIRLWQGGDQFYKNLKVIPTFNGITSK